MIILFHGFFPGTSFISLLVIDSPVSPYLMASTIASATLVNCSFFFLAILPPKLKKPPLEVALVELFLLLVLPQPPSLPSPSLSGFVGNKGQIEFERAYALAQPCWVKPLVICCLLIIDSILLRDKEGVKNNSQHLPYTQMSALISSVIA